MFIEPLAMYPLGAIGGVISEGNVLVAIINWVATKANFYANDECIGDSILGLVFCICSNYLFLQILSP